MFKIGKEIIDRVVPRTENPSIFSYIDAIINGERYSAFKYLKDLIQCEDALKIAYMLCSHFNRLVSTKFSNEIHTSWFMKKMEEQSKKISEDNLLKCELKLTYVIFNLKGLDINNKGREQILFDLTEELLGLVK